MAEKNANLKDSIAVLEEVENRLEGLLNKRKGEIEKELEERIRAEKAEADRKIDAIVKEIQKGREILHDYRTVISEFENERTSLQRQIKEHFEKAVSYQTEIEQMAGQTMEELRKINELTQKLESLHHEAEEKVNTYKKDLEERFGIVAQLPESKEEEELKIDLEQEVLKLKKIKELLEAETVVAEEQVVEPEAAPEAGPETAPEPEAAEAAEPALPEEPEVPNNVPEINQVMESALEEAQVEEEAAEAPQPEEKAQAAEGLAFQTLFNTLEKFRKSEPRGNNGEISFFEKDDKSILDGEFIVASIDETLEEAKRLYLKLSQTESPKEQFFVKQEIINHQEVLRKFILRSVKLCEKENFTLPTFTEEILNLDALKNILEKLSMENWSNPADFSSFRTLVETLKDAYYARITPPVNYLKSLIEELGV